MAAAPLIAAIVGAAATAASTGYAISKGSGSLPKAPPPPPPPPPAPPPPAAPPPPPTETQADEGPAKAKRKRATAYGIDETLLVSPLGGGSDISNSTAGTGKTLLGG